MTVIGIQLLSVVSFGMARKMDSEVIPKVPHSDMVFMYQNSPAGNSGIEELYAHPTRNTPEDGKYNKRSKNRENRDKKEDSGVYSRVLRDSVYTRVLRDPGGYARVLRSAEPRKNMNYLRGYYPKELREVYGYDLMRNPKIRNYLRGLIRLPEEPKKRSPFDGHAMLDQKPGGYMRVLRNSRPMTYMDNFDDNYDNTKAMDDLNAYYKIPMDQASYSKENIRMLPRLVEGPMKRSSFDDYAGLDQEPGGYMRVLRNPRTGKNMKDLRNSLDNTKEIVDLGDYYGVPINNDSYFKKNQIIMEEPEKRGHLDDYAMMDQKPGGYIRVL